jgi:hypothetical protein
MAQDGPTTEELAAELRRRGKAVFDPDVGLDQVSGLRFAAHWLRRVGAIVIERDENGEWPEWAIHCIPIDEFDESPQDVLDALAAAQEKQE